MECRVLKIANVHEDNSIIELVILKMTFECVIGCMEEKTYLTHSHATANSGMFLKIMNFL